MAACPVSTRFGMVPRWRRKDISFHTTTKNQITGKALRGVVMTSNEARDTFLSLKELCNDPANKAGINAIKYEASVLACITCLAPLEHEVSDTDIWRCPKCGKLRNRQQRIWLAYKTYVDFRQVGLNNLKGDFKI